MYDQPPMIKKMSERLIFDLERRESQWVFRDGIDRYVQMPVSPDELRQLGQELISLAEMRLQ